MKNRTENLKKELEQLIDQGRVLSSPPIVKKARELENSIWKKIITKKHGITLT